MKSLFIASLLVVALAGCDKYHGSFGNLKVNEVTVYDNIRCAMPVDQSGGLAISCDWDHPIGGAAK